MKKKLWFQKTYFRVIIGEEGAVFGYFIGNTLQNKMFAVHNNEASLSAITNLLKQDPDADIEIYLDVLDQSYVQRTLPAIGMLGIGSLARKRLAKETPAGHFKHAVQIGASKAGRHDWLYVFISAAYDAPITTWVNFLLSFDNNIKSVHFLPVEIYSVVAEIKTAIQKIADSKNNTLLDRTIRYAKNIFLKSKSFISLFQTYYIENRTWEVLLVHNKSGGIRQVVYQDGNVIFTRLMNNIYDSNPEVFAGNIEQEINNSLEYLNRLPVKPKEIILYAIIAEDMHKHVRINKIYAQHVYLYSPYQLSNLIGLPQNISKEQDTFTDPVLLALLGKSNRKKITVYNSQIYKVFLFKRAVLGLKYLLLLAVPCMSVLISVFIIETYKISKINSAYYAEQQVLQSNLIHINQEKDKALQSFGSKENAEIIKDIISIYNNLSFAHLNPLQLIQEIANIDRQNVRIRHFKYITHKEQNNLMPIQSQDEYHNSYYTIISTLTFLNYTNKYENLLTNYNNFGNILRAQHPDSIIKIAALPSNFSLNNVEEEVSVELHLTTKIDSKDDLRKS